jgi:UDP-glucose:glycoprotein glucosyltransferase
MELYEKFLGVLQEDGHISSPEALSTFKLALSMRSAAPRIEAHYQYYATGVELHLGSSSPEGCDPWVYFSEKQYCSPALTKPGEQHLGNSYVLQKDLMVLKIITSTRQAKNLPFDRSLGTGNDAILYADITSPDFGPFHKSLAAQARRGEISYRIRYRKTPGHKEEPLAVNGYGVELALKKTDYIVIDDREAEAGSDQKPIGAEVVLGEEEVTDLKALSKSELASLGLKTASYIMQSEKPFETLLKIVQDFPKYSTSIAAHNASEKFVAEHEANRLQMVPAGANVMWMNGVQLIDRQIEPFNLVDMLRRERKLISGVKNLGLTGKQAVSLLGHPKVSSAKPDDEPLRFDWRDEAEEGRVILWLNDLEQDERYEDFPTSLMSVSTPALVSVVLSNIALAVATNIPWPSPANQERHLQPDHPR